MKLGWDMLELGKELGWVWSKYIVYIYEFLRE